MLLLERASLKVINGIVKKTYKMGISIFQNLKYVKKMVKSYNIFDESKPKQWLDKVISSLTGKVYLTCRYMNGILISLLLVQQNIERNPGERKNVNLEIVTYNCNGLQNKVKLGRVLNKAARMVENNSIVLLQETHIINDEDIRQRWRSNFEVNGNTTNRAGVITLFPLDYKPILTFKNVNGRYIISVLQNDRMKILVANVYLPNDHKESEDIVVEIYEKILEIVEIHPDAYIVLGGDMNTCIGINDSMNRAGSKIEEKVSEKISNYNQICNLTDGYRVKHEEGGYTWSRGICYSRLDYIFISDELRNNLVEAKIDWAFDQSDHAAVKVGFTFLNTIVKGPGLPKININVLDDPKVKQRIESEINEQLGQMPSQWDPHLKLEFMKVAIRSVFAQQTSVRKTLLRTEIEETESAVNVIEEFRLEIMNKSNVDRDEQISNIDIARIGLKSRLVNLRKEENDLKEFKSRAKWFEFGEKSNKHFLNLEKSRERQKLISVIENDGIKYTGQKQISQGIRDFYSKLYEKNNMNSVEADIDNSFFEHCPSLNERERVHLDREITLEELELALSSCKDSAPGSDGIPYSVYKHFWKSLGPIIKNAWDHSIQTGKMPSSHRESVITLLPKEGKDLKEIKNWRPIALSNCDAKIITKALAGRMSTILDSIIDPAQTAYVKGRSVMDNIRCNLFLKKYCKNHNIDACLTSLDAKKAFDSVDHNYIDKVLSKYGFGNKFRKYFKIIYTDLKSKVMVNGYLTEEFNIERGVKQGDALSCAIFILCIDPLIRNMNRNEKIKMIDISPNKSGNKIKHKASGYADDISVVTLNDRESIEEIFNEYQRLTKHSGLELNAEKTEILQLNNDRVNKYEVKYGGKINMIKCVDRIKICGINFCKDLNEEYKMNVTDKIIKFEYKLKPWLHRYLTFEGKVLIIKTFGLSQLIYNMQCVFFEESQLREIESKMFCFLWAKNSGGKKPIDRIKRKVMKSNYDEGGLKVTDVECLDKALKLKQYIRANNVKHNIGIIQEKCREASGASKGISESLKITNLEDVTKVAQITINLISKHSDQASINLDESEDSEIINYKIKRIAATNISTYLEKNRKVMAICIYKKLRKEGIRNLIDLLRENEIENNNDRKKRITLVLSSFPKIMKEIAIKFTNDDEVDEDELLLILDSKNDTLIPINNITTKEIQVILKTVLNRIEKADFMNKLNAEYFEVENIMKFRESCKNAKLRNIYFRAIHNDFFSNDRMMKFKMTDSNKCSRCEEIETSKHLLWDCREAKRIWEVFNEVIKEQTTLTERVQKYEDIFQMYENKVLNMIKVKIIQQSIQIKRISRWTTQAGIDLIKDLKIVEEYGAKKSHKMVQHNLRWNRFKI
jgi:exonuclease III